MKNELPGDGVERTLSRSDVEKVLARAIEIEATRDEITERELVEIGGEVGIHPEAIRAALAEQRSGAPLEASAPKGSMRALIAGGAAFTLLGAGTRAIRPLIEGRVHWEALTALAVIVAALLMLAWRPTRVRSQRTFQAYNVVIWAGYALGFSLVHGSLWDDLAFVTVLSAAGSAIVGGVIVKLRRPPTSGARPGAAERWSQAVNRFGKLVREKLTPDSNAFRRATLQPDAG